MKKTFRKAIAVLLAVLMVAFSVPFSAFAANTEQNTGGAIGWWGDSNFKGWENPNIPQGEQDYEGWNGDTYQLGLAWADAVTAEADLGMGADAIAMMSNYKPVLTVTVSDQGTADNRIYRQYYGYSTSYDYDTVKAAGNILNPADLKAGQRIAVTFEIGGFDMLYAGQIKGVIDTSKLAYAYYTLNPSTTDRWKQCSSTQTTQAFITRGYGYYGDAATDGGGQITNNTTGQFYCPFSSNTPTPSSAYCGKDLRPYGKDGMIICTLSMEVLQDCNLAEAIDFTKDDSGGSVNSLTSFSCYDYADIGTERNRFTFATDDEMYTCGLIALNYNDYDASGSSSECTHSSTTATAAKDPTCTEAGNSAYWTCNDCGKMFSDENCTTEITEIPTIAATGHSLTKTEAKDATCTEAGNSAYWTCSVCGKMFSDANGETEIAEIPTISATGHSLAKVDEVPSTCTVKGTAAYWTCTACGKMFSDAEGTTEITAPAELPLADHSYDMVKTEATCTEASSEVYTCSVCGDTYTTHVDSAKGHTEVSANNGVAATCTTDGKESDTVCSVCGETLTVGATIPAPGHSYSMVKTDATCTEASSEVYTCSVCGDTYTTHVDSALGHDFSVVVSSTAGDCQTLGTTTYKCSRCDATNTVEGAYGPHTEVSANNAVAATCTTDGKESDTVCSVCGETLTTGAVIPATGHTEVSADNGYAATCTEDGKESDTVCSVCGETLVVGATLPATGHTPGEPDETIIKEPTCTEKGEKNTTVTCTECGKELSSVNEELGELGHDYVEGDTVPPTLSEDGYTVYTCSRCGDIEKRNIVPALEGVNITVEATDLGTTAINDTDATNGATVKVLKNSAVTLTATPVEGAEFVGWALNGKIVSESATATVVALADVTYTPVFTETADATFTVVFVDNYGNVISTQTVADASEIVAPTAPARPGYTFKGWSVDYTTLTEGATIYAQFEKDAATTYTVTATGCTITTAAGDTATDVMTDVAYDTLVTVTANDNTAASWKIGDTTVAFGESYTFYVGSDVEVVPQFDSAVIATPTVSAVNVSDIVKDGKTKAVFLATRSMTDDCTYISSGYIYGLAANVTADTTLDDVNGTSIRRTDNKTASEQFSVICGIGSQTGSLAAKAYLAYVDANGDTQVIYADVQTYTYA